MARCDCAGGRCSCGITPGEGITITGSGEASNPFVITADRQSITGQLAVTDTATLDLTLIGEGTENEPYTISGNVIAEPPSTITGLIDAGTNVTITGAGTIADPYIISADDPESIAGFIEAGTNITFTGTGTVADPYIVSLDAITGLIEAGTNVTFTGTGTTADPYVVSQTADIVPDAITGLIEAGTDITFTGTGTTADPYIVALTPGTVSDAITGLIEPGDNITVLGTGTTADPYIIAGTSEDTVITGLMQAGTNVQLTGTGTAADPYVVASVQALNDLTDVVILSTPTDGQVLQYSTGASAWGRQTPTWVPQNHTLRGQYLLSASVVWDPASIAVGAQASTFLTVTGVSLSNPGWVFDVKCSINRQGLHMWADVTATNVVTIYASNTTAAAVNLGSATFTVYGWQ